MAVPTVVGVGPKGSGTGNVQYLYTGVSYQANDIGLLFIETANATTISVDQGWTQITSSPQSSTATILHCWWKRLSASETGPTATQGGTTNHQCGGIIVIRGCVASGNPWDITNGTIETTSDTSVSVPGGTTTIDNCLVLAATSDGTDSNTAQGTGTPTNPDLTEVAYTALNYNTTSGNGGGIVIMKGVRGTAGTYGASGMTLVTASDKGLINIALKSPATQTISNAGNIPSGFAAGVATILLTLAAVGNIPSAEAFGTAKLNQNLNPTGIESAEAFGLATISFPAEPQTISNAGNIATSEAFGIPKFNQNLSPPGIVSAEAFGVAKLNQQLSPAGIASAETFGTAKLNQNLSPVGIASAEAFGPAKLNQNLSPPGISSAETFGTATISIGGEPQTISNAGNIASAEAFGAAKLNQQLLPVGIASAEVFGTAKLNQNLLPSGITSTETFGTAKLNQNLNPSGIISEETFGIATISKPGDSQIISNAGNIASSETFGIAQLKKYQVFRTFIRPVADYIQIQIYARHRIIFAIITKDYLLP